MNKFYNLLVYLLLLAQITNAQDAEPDLGGAYFSMSSTPVGTNVTLTFSYANSGSTAIPAGSVEISLSAPANFYTSDGTTMPNDMGSGGFSWTYVGSDTWKGINGNIISAFDGGDIQMVMTGIQLSANYELTNINIQAINNFSLFNNSPLNDNLQLGLKIDPIAGSIAIQAKVLLQGSFPFGGSMMYDSLRNLGLIPLTEPYTAANSFSHAGEGGGETINADVLQQTGNDAIVDWVFVELRSSSDETQVVSTKAGLVQRDGDIVDTSGVDMLTFSSLAPADYYVAVRHRNHLGAMTTNSVALSTTPTVVDFTTMNDSGTYGTHAQKDLLDNGSLWGLWAGNSTVDGYEIFQGIDNEPNTIFFDVLSAPNNTDFLANYINRPVYSDSDVNMDGQVIFQGPDNEPNYVFFNVLSYPSNTTSIKNFIMIEQLP